MKAAQETKNQFYFHHSECECSRLQLQYLKTSQNPHAQNKNPTVNREQLLQTISSVEDGTFVGRSSCDEFTSLLGSGQRVIAYSLYVPWNANNQSQSSDGEPTDSYTPRYLELMEELAVSVARMYPGWRMRQCCNEYSNSNLFF